MAQFWSRTCWRLGPLCRERLDPIAIASFYLIMSRLAELASIVNCLHVADRERGGGPPDLRGRRTELLEACYGLVDAIDRGGGEQVDDALGHMLFLVLSLSAQRAEKERGGIETVAALGRSSAASAACENPVNPVQPRDCAQAVTGDKRERNPSILDAVPQALPALIRTHRQGQTAAAVGFDWADPAGVLAKLDEELEELSHALDTGRSSAIAHEYGDLLMAMACLGRHIGVSPEDALREATNRFAERFATMETMARARDQELAELDAAALDGLWEEAKRRLLHTQSDVEDGDSSRGG